MASSFPGRFDNLSRRKIEPVSNIDHLLAPASVSIVTQLGNKFFDPHKGRLVGFGRTVQGSGQTASEIASKVLDLSVLHIAWF